jgi:hypothetical protein
MRGNGGSLNASANGSALVVSSGLSSGCDPTDPIHLELENELQKLIVSENNLDRELAHCYSILAQGKSLLKGVVGSGSAGPGASVGPGAYDSNDISHSLNRIDHFDPAFELISQDSKKLCFQIDECRQLSDRLSAMVRRLDTIQLRAQEALACTEDVLNLKECHLAISSALESGNLALAVSYVRQVHDIDEQAARASDDYGALQQIEAQVRDLVKAQFELAIKNSDLDEVLRLCPHLRVVGLESAATDLFLAFIESAVFIGISANAAPVESDSGSGSEGTTALYAGILSSIFNSVFTICQRYLPVVIQGLERTQGDILFLRRLHNKCEREVDVVMKKYLASRNLRGVIASLRSPSSAGQGKPSPAPPSSAEMHAHLDELALLLQYCGSYSRYLKMLCEGAENRVRGAAPTTLDAPAAPLVVFKAPTPFDGLQQELINLYYIEGEHWLIRSAVETFVKGLSRCASARGQELHQPPLDIDGSFFVFQRCSQRAIATNNIHAACAILHVLSDHLSTDILQQFSDSLSAVVAFVGNKMRSVMSRFLKSSAWYSGSEEPSDSSLSTGRSGYIPQGLHNALLFASSLSQETPDVTGPGSASGGEGGGMWGVEAHMEMLNLLETCIRYTDRLRREIASTGRSIFGDATQAQAPVHQHHPPGGSRTVTAKPSILSDEASKLQLCIEDFESCKESLNQVSQTCPSVPSDPHLPPRRFGKASRASRASPRRS